MNQNQADPIWGELPAYFRDPAGDYLDVECARSGGRYRISGSALSVVQNLSVAEKAKLTTWIVNKIRLFPESTPKVTTYVIDEIKAAKAKTASEQIDSFLLFLAMRDIRIGASIVWMGLHANSEINVKEKQLALAHIEGRSETELYGLRDILIDGGYIKKEGEKRYHPTAKAFERIDEMKRNPAPSKQVFVAMWFSADTDAAYSEGIKKAILDTGFIPLRIDEKEHINKIDDEIISEIRRSAFVIADFTSGVMINRNRKEFSIPRGGVYYEAGFAQGLGIPVIWTVRSDQIDKVHFDTRQFNHIAWQDTADLYERLRNRIRALFLDAV